MEVKGDFVLRFGGGGGGGATCGGEERLCFKIGGQRVEVKRDFVLRLGVNVWR